MHISYTPNISGELVLLNEEESKHCINVLRMKLGDELLLVDGLGGRFQARISQPHPKKCEVSIYASQKAYQKRAFHLHIACAPTKNIERFEWFLEKATELGIDAVTPLQCEHSERTIVKHERLEKVLVSAMKQSQKAYLPVLDELTSFKKFLENSNSFEGQKFIAHCYETEKVSLQKAQLENQNVLILIGPEGDFSKIEVEAAVAQNFIPLSLSTSRLRTETAALAACHAFNFCNGF